MVMSTRPRTLSFHTLLALAAAVGLAGVFGAPVRPAAAAPVSQGCAGNLLANPGFDAGSYKTESLGTSLSSSSGEAWTPWFINGNDETWNREPEFKLNIPGLTGDAYRVRAGNSMKWFTTWGTHDAGVWQRVGVSPGAAVTFSAHGMIYSGEDDGHRPDLDTFFSDPEKNGSYRMQVGIDPYGNTPAMGAPPPDTVVWSAEEFTPDVFVNQAVTTVARAGAVTVFVRGKAIWPVKHNDSFWEDTCLRYGGGAPAPAPVAVEAAAPEPVVAAPVAVEAAAAEPVVEAPAPDPAAEVSAAEETDDAPRTRRSTLPKGQRAAPAQPTLKRGGNWAVPR